MKLTKELFDRFSLAFSVPVKMYRKNELLFSCERAAIHPDPIHIWMNPYIGRENPVCIVITEDSILNGYISLSESNEEYLLIGPVLQHKLNLSQVKKICLEFGLSKSDAPDLERLLYQLPIMNSPSFYNMIDFFRLMLEIDNPIKVIHEEISPKRKAIAKNNFINIPENNGYISITDESLLPLIMTGNVEELSREFNNISFSSSKPCPKLALDEIRSQKNIFICSAAVASRAAITGGLDYQTAITLSDLYISQVENMTSSLEIQQTLFEMLLDYTNRVRLAIHPKTNSITIDRIYRDIQEHRHEKITTDNISKRLKMTKSYLCHHFKEKTGETITEYIHKVKIKEAEYLLDTTDSPLSEISEMLSFSSQQQFQHIFKEISGLTPMQYRNRNRAE